MGFKIPLLVGEQASTYGFKSVGLVGLVTLLS